MDTHPEYAGGQYVLPPLPYACSALEPLIGEETVRLHHDKHHAAYVAGANAAAEALREIAAGRKDASLTPLYAGRLAFNEAGHILHTLYWNNMTPAPKSGPPAELAEAIRRQFGSFEGMMLLFRTTAVNVQGSGWSLLGLDPASGELQIAGVEKHQCGAAPGFAPLLACDVWEHAYYLGYKNDRAAYVENFVKLINWEDVGRRYESARRARR